MNMYRTRFILIFFIFYGFSIRAQKQYSFNSPNNPCYFQFLCFAPDNDYREGSKPFIFVIGKQGETAADAMQNDTLKNIPQFFSYMFVYIPNRGETSPEKLYCLPALAGLLTYNTYANVFCYIKDESMTVADINASPMGKYFKRVKLLKAPADPMVPTVTDTSNITNNTDLVRDFKADAIIVAGQRAKPLPYLGPPLNFKFTLSGKLVDAYTYEALPFATVAIKGKPIGTVTNADGMFTLLQVPTDTTTLVISYLGYKRTEFQLTPLLNKSSVLIEMEQQLNMITEIKVTAEREDLMAIGGENLGLVKMSPAKLNQLPNIGEKDIMRSFQLMPGVSASNESSSGLYVRGGTPDQNLVLYDGFTVYQVDHLYGFFSAFNSNALKDVQLFKGGFESKFGGRLSSVTEITGKDGNQKNMNIGGDISLLSGNAFVEAPIGKKFTFLGAFRRSYQGLIYNEIFRQYNTQQAQQTGRNNFASTVSSYFYDLNSKLTFRPTKKDILSLSVYNGTDKLDNGRNFTSSSGSFSAQIVDLTKYGNLGGSLKWSRKWNDKIYGNTLLSYSNFYSNRERSNSFSAINGVGAVTTRKFGTFENNDLKDFSFKSDYIFDLFSNHQIGAGVSATYFDILYNYSQNDTSTILNRHNFGVLTSAYLQDKIKIADGKIIFVPGIRASYFSVTSASQPYYYEPRFSATYNITHRLSLKAATGKYYQFANQVVREDILNGNKNFWVLSDGQNVPVGQAIHYVAGISYDMHDYLFSVEGWYKDLSGLTQHTLRFNTSPTHENYSENFYKGTGYSQGLEFLAQKKFGDFSGWVSYTMSKTRSLFNVYSPNYYASDQDVPNEFKIIGIYKWKKFSFSATWIYASGRPYTAPSGAYSLTLLDGTTQSYYTVSSKNSLRLPDYNRLDIAATYQFKNDQGREYGSIGFSIFNLYNRRNVWYKEFQIVDKQIVETNIQYLGITPNITLSLKLR
ncbi:MAG TPA: TonB-dependent receptor [Bacteroidia bacterium]|jgi:ferric enterobactin receptor|nr:TonB-dependent receptor [Bacteroidia bacterium]